MKLGDGHVAGLEPTLDVGETLADAGRVVPITDTGPEHIGLALKPALLRDCTLELGPDFTVSARH